MLLSIYQSSVVEDEEAKPPKIAFFLVAGVGHFNGDTSQKNKDLGGPQALQTTR